MVIYANLSYGNTFDPQLESTHRHEREREWVRGRRLQGFLGRNEEDAKTQQVEPRLEPDIRLGSSPKTILGSVMCVFSNEKNLGRVNFSPCECYLQERIYWIVCDGQSFTKKPVLPPASALALPHLFCSSSLLRIFFIPIISFKSVWTSVVYKLVNLMSWVWMKCTSRNIT